VQTDVPDSCHAEIAEALLQNTIVRRIGLEPQDYDFAGAIGKISGTEQATIVVQLTHFNHFL
jgi:hypothetical protein